MQATAVYTNLTESAAAGRDLGDQISTAFDGESPDAVILFASSRFEYPHLLEAIHEGCDPDLLVGSSSAGEFTRDERGEGTACALAIRSDEIKLAAGFSTGVRENRTRAASEMLKGFEGLTSVEFPYRAALVMTDALAGHADDLVEQLTLLTSGKYQFAGGGAGDDAHFARTHVFCGKEAHTDAVVGLEFLSHKPVAIGVDHGWFPSSAPLRVTEASGMKLVSLNGVPAVEAFEAHAEKTGQRFDRNDPFGFFLHNVLGIDTGNGHRLRVPLSVNEDGSINCAADILTGSRVNIMNASAESAVEAAAKATSAALLALNGAPPGAALFFDCVATRLRLGDVFGFELDTVSEKLAGIELVGCNTYGQIARAEGQFGGFHNCTAVVMLLPS